MIGADLLRFQDYQRYLIFDIESEGLSLTRSRPWQLAYALCTNRAIEAMTVRYPLFKDINVSDEAARVTRFDKSTYLARGEDPAQVLRDFEEIAMDPSVLVVGHNILGFDAYVWQTLRRLHGLPTDWSYVPRMIDTLCLSRAYRFGLTPDLKAFTAWQYKMLTIRSKAKGMGASLGAMAREFEVPYDERQAHDAAYDLQINHKVFRQLVYKVEV